VRDVSEEVAAAVPVTADPLDALLDLVGHRVELGPELRDLGRRVADVGSRDPGAELALRQRRDASVRRRSGVVTRSAIAAATITAIPRARAPTAAVTVATLPIAVWRNV
jgi:hypothetical protein